MKSVKFLIVEDEAIIAFLLRKNLVQAGHQVCGMAVNGQQAVEIARRESPQVILMDIGLLGDMDGIQAAQEILSFLSASVIFTTGYSEPHLKERANALNPSAYLTKPINMSQINAVLNTVYEME